MIYITGDCHGEYNKISAKNFPESKLLTSSDYIIVCGDFGYWHKSKEQDYWLSWLGSKPYTILFVSGNHENYDALNQLPITTWHGGKVQFISDNVIHLMRGQIYEIEGKTFFTFGGASSHDTSGGILELDDPDFDMKAYNLRKRRIPYRINHISWWKEELPSQEEMKEGLQNLENSNFQVDYIISHCCSTSTQEKINDKYKADILTDYFEKIKEKVTFRHWYFGHYHDDLQVSNNETLLYKNIILLS